MAIEPQGMNESEAAWRRRTGQPGQRIEKTTEPNSFWIGVGLGLGVVVGACLGGLLFFGFLWVFGL